ncbi:MAG TPA: hypothetical protein VHF02_11160 [Luteimonas sp.]|nr:hypothetical protein [Luteimonas sp.]
MDTALFTVSPSLVGWLVSDGDRIEDIFSSRFWALKGADALAHKRHVETGQPTAVVLNYIGGETFVAGRYD